MTQDRTSTVVDGTSSLAVVAVSLVSHPDPLDIDEVRSVIDAAAGAGFTGLSARATHHDWAVAGGMSSAEYYAYHRERGVSIVSMSLCSDWATSDLRAVTEANAHLIEVAARGGARSIVAAHVTGDLPPLAVAAKGLAHVCDLAAERGLLVSFEFIPSTGVPDLKSALRLMEEVDRDNFGLVFDTWQWFRGPDGPDWETLRTVPADVFHILQLCDARERPAVDVRVESVADRLLPGHGVIDLVGVLDLLHERRASPVVVAEVLSSSLLAELGAHGLARAQFEATAEVIDRHLASVARPGHDQHRT